MFFKNYYLFISLKFLWVGLIFGVIKIAFDIFNKITRNNVFVFNLIYFVFWSSLSYFFILLCKIYYNYSFCWFGLLLMLTGLISVKISLNFLLTNLTILLYHCVNRLKLRKLSNEKK